MPTVSFSDKDYGKTLHDFEQCLMSNSVHRVRVPKGATPEIADVIQSFGSFIASGAEPYLFKGFARLKFSERALQAAEPYIREMLGRGYGTAYVQAGLVPCQVMANGMKKSRLGMRRILAAPMCSTCAHNVGGRCKLVGNAKLSSVASVEPEDVAVAHRHLVESRVLSRKMAHAVVSLSNDPAQQLEALAKAVELKQHVQASRVADSGRVESARQLAASLSVANVELGGEADAQPEEEIVSVEHFAVAAKVPVQMLDNTDHMDSFLDAAVTKARPDTHLQHVEM